MILIYLLIILVPIINLLLIAVIISQFIVYCCGINVFIANLKISADPFDNMILSPEICQYEKTNIVYKKIEKQGISYRFITRTGQTGHQRRV